MPLTRGNYPAGLRAKSSEVARFGVTQLAPLTGSTPALAKTFSECLAGAELTILRHLNIHGGNEYTCTLRCSLNSLRGDF